MSSHAESEPEVRTVEDVIPGIPPKSRAYDEFNPERVCQATGGASEDDETSVHGDEEESNATERSRVSRSPSVGADVYEYALYWSVLPPWE